MLDSLTKGGSTYNYTYDIDGIRTSKTVNGHTNSYYLAGSQIVHEQPIATNIAPVALRACLASTRKRRGHGAGLALNIFV